MTIEKYFREYYCDADGLQGYQICNHHSGFEGSVNLPGFKIAEPLSEARIDGLLAQMSIEFCSYNEQQPFDAYIAHGLRRLFLGQKSDWKIAAIFPKPGSLRLHLQNRKIAQMLAVLEHLDVDGIKFQKKGLEGRWQIDPEDVIQLQWQGNVDDSVRHCAVVEFEIPAAEGELEHHYFNLKFRHKRRDIKGEVDFYGVTVNRRVASIEETHRLSPMRREITLSFRDQVDASGDKIMFAEIKECR